MQSTTRSKPCDLDCAASGSSRSEEGPNYCETEHGRWVGVVKEFVENLHYGEVVLSVHGGRVVQVERTEKVRFN